MHSVPEAGGEIVLVRDYDEAIRFYTGALGLRVEEDLTIEPGGRRWVLLDQSRPYNRLLLLEASVAPRHCADTHSSFSLFTDEIGLVVTELKRRGIVFRRELEAADKGMTAEFEDPDGNLVTLLG